MPVIDADNVSKRYSDGTLALDDVSLEVEKGEFYGFLGKNGAGKTSLINVLTGQVEPDSGTVSVLGVNPKDSPAESRRDIGILPEKESPITHLKPEEHFRFVAEVRGINEETLAEQVDYWKSKLNLDGKMNSLNKNLSRGQQQKVMFASAFLHEPELVFIDEPMVNLDPIMQGRLKEYLKDYNDRGKTIVLSTHYTEAAMELCDKVGIMSEGKPVAEHRTEDIESLEQVREILSQGD